MTDHPRYYWTADRAELVGEGDPRAASLAYTSVDPVPPEHLAMLAAERSGEIEHGTEDNAPAPKPVKRATKPAPKPSARRPTTSKAPELEV